MRKQVLIILTLVVLAGSSGSGSQMGRYASRNLSSVSETHSSTGAKQCQGVGRFGDCGKQGTPPRCHTILCSVNCCHYFPIFM